MIKHNYKYSIQYWYFCTPKKLIINRYEESFFRYQKEFQKLHETNSQYWFQGI